MNNPESPNSLPSTNVHEALQEASLESKNKVPMISFSTRIDPNTKAQAQQICERHGTDLSTYLRKCAEALVNDYKSE